MSTRILVIAAGLTVVMNVSPAWSQGASDAPAAAPSTSAAFARSSSGSKVRPVFRAF